MPFAHASGMKKPNFLFIGPDKSGSTWLYEILRAHPNCFVPKLKDIYFFDRHYDRGINWYLRFFADAPETAVAIGELSHDYLFSSAAAERIARDLPGVRLITCLRNPVERTFSHYLYLVRSGLTRLPFEQALESYPELIENSRYATHLECYLLLFPKDSVKVLLFDKLKADAEDFAKDVFTFLGVPFVDTIDYERLVLPASRPRGFHLAKLAKLGSQTARRMGFPGLVAHVKASFVSRLLYTPYSSQDKPRIGEATQERLYACFEKDIWRLQEMLDIDLRGWLRQ